MLRLGQGYGIRDDTGRIVASTMILPYPPRLGWIGMILVHVRFRKRGYATRLLHHAVSLLGKRGLIPMLDATPVGQHVYRKLGFTPLSFIQRWRGGGTGYGVEAKAPFMELANALAMDEAAFGASRQDLLCDLVYRPWTLTLQAAGGRGHLFSRVGRTATQIGPVLAETESVAVELCAKALDGIEGNVILDVPVREVALTEMLAERGFSIERHFARMGLGVELDFTCGGTMHVTAGPELG